LGRSAVKDSTFSPFEKGGGRGILRLFKKLNCYESSNEYFNLSASSRISAVWDSFRLLGIKPFFGTPPDEDKRMNVEEAESAEFLPWTALSSLGVWKALKMALSPPFAPGP